jgi:hypothetical protein
VHHWVGERRYNLGERVIKNIAKVQTLIFHGKAIKQPSESVRNYCRRYSNKDKYWNDNPPGDHHEKCPKS